MNYKCFHCEKIQPEENFLIEIKNSFRLNRGITGLYHCNKCSSGDNGFKRCTVCLKLLSIEDFNKRRAQGSLSGRENKCGKCKYERQKNRINADPERQKNIKIRNKNNKEERYLRNPQKEWAKYLRHTAKANARKRKKEFSLDRLFVEELFSNQDNKCSVTKIPFDFNIPSAYTSSKRGVNIHSIYQPSLDRANSSEGYSHNNIRLVVRILNLARNKLSDMEMNRLFKSIIKKENSQKEMSVPFNYQGIMLTNAKMRTKNSSFKDFELDIDWIKEHTRKGVCNVTGIPFKLSKTKKQRVSDKSNWRYPSIDRINNEIGYTKKNSRIVVWGYNQAKNVWNDQQIKKIARLAIANSK